MTIISQLNRPAPASLTSLPVVGATAAVLVISGFLNLAVGTLGHVLSGLLSLGLAGFTCVEIYRSLSEPAAPPPGSTDAP